MSKIARPLFGSIRCHVAICAVFMPQLLLAQTPPAPPLPGETPVKPPAAAGGMRVAPPSVVEVGELPSQTPPKPPEQLDVPVPGQVLPNLGTVPGVLLPIPMLPPGSQPPALQRVYRVGKFTIKYGTDIRKRYPKLPTEEALGKTVVSLLESGGTLYHASKRRGANKPGQAAQVPPTGSSPPNGLAIRDGLDLALHRPLPPAPGELKSGAAGAGIAPATAFPAGSTGAAKKSETKGDKKIPQAIPKPVVVDGVPHPVKVSDFQEPRMVSAMAIQDVYDAIVKRLSDRGLIGIYLMAGVDPQSGQDLRKETVDIEVQIFVSEVAKLRTISRRVPFRVGDLPKINDDDAPDQPVGDPKHLWIKAKSPLFVFDKKKGGGLLQKDRLQSYLSRLNRFPGRRVDAAINATGDTGKVQIDYLIREQKNFLAYFQEENNGTKSTGEWRSRIGIELRQLANKDDILRLDYTTSNLDQYNAGILSYQFALIKPDVLKMKLYGLYGNYSAQDVGFAGANFKGETMTAGAAITWTPLYWHGFPLDVTVGAEVLRASVENGASGLKSATNFILPYVALGTERVTDRFTLAANAQIKGSFGNSDQDALNGLGRFGADGSFWMTTADLSASFFLEPLLLGSKWGDLGENGDKWRRGILANEVAITAHAQYTLGDRRLIPQLELIAGGFNTVRGYPESLTSGDSGIVGSFEYRLHVPRLFKPSGVAAKTAKKLKTKPATATADATAKTKPGTKGKAGAAPDAAPGTPPVVTAVDQRGDSPASKFHLRPGVVGGGADWDLIFRLFADFGQTYNNQRIAAIEENRTLFSVGSGLELQFFKPTYFSVRLDYGVVIEPQSALLVNPVRAGEGRFHISATIAW